MIYSPPVNAPGGIWRVPRPSFVHQATIDPSTSPTTELGSRGAHKQKSINRGETVSKRAAVVVMIPAVRKAVELRWPTLVGNAGGASGARFGGEEPKQEPCRPDLPVMSTIVAVWQSESCPSVVALQRLSIPPKQKKAEQS